MKVNIVEDGPFMNNQTALATATAAVLSDVAAAEQRGWKIIDPVVLTVHYKLDQATKTFTVVDAYASYKYLQPQQLIHSLVGFYEVTRR